MISGHTELYKKLKSIYNKNIDKASVIEQSFEKIEKILIIKLIL